MATHLLKVPKVAQRRSMSCWHASAQMIWLYWQGKTGRQGPMWTLAKEWNENTGLPVNAYDHIRLAQNAGLKKVPRLKKYTTGDLLWMLKRFGPIWCCGPWYGFYHIVVLTGVKDNTVYINDPDGGVEKTGTIAWFNQKLANDIDGCLMYKDPKAY